MWTRQEVKRKGKTAFFASYWKFVLVAVIIGVISGGASGISSGFSSMGSGFGNMIGHMGNSGDDYYFEDGELHIDGEDSSVDIKDGKLSLQAKSEDGQTKLRIEDGQIYVNDENEGMNFEINTDDGVTTVSGTDSDGSAYSYVLGPNLEINLDGKEINIDKGTVAVIAGVVIVVVLVIMIISLIVAAFTIALDIFVLNPIEYGCMKFLRKSQNGNESLGTVFTGFKDGYRNIVKVLFFRDLFIFLWSLLFVIPGIVKSYEYRMVPYLLSENPGMSKDEALKASSAMMSGQKWRAFVLDLSFIGWHLLAALTFGVLEIFYVAPYQYSTNAALYETLKEEQR